MSITIKTTVLILLVILVTGFSLRFYQVAKNPVSLYWDEAAMAEDAWSLAQTGKDMHGNSGIQAIFPSYGDYKLPLYIWLSALSLKLFGPTITALRLVSVIAGTGLIAITYLLGKLLFRSTVVALGSAAAVALSPWAIQFSRAGFEANVAVFWVSLSLYWLWRSFKKPGWLIPAALAAAAGVYSYFSVQFVIPLIAITAVILNLKELPAKFWWWAAGAGLVFGLLLLPIYRSPNYPASNQVRLSTPSLLNTDSPVIQQNINRQLAGNTRVSRLVYHRYIYLAQAFLTNLTANLDLRYLFFWGDPNLRHGTGQVGLMLLPTLPMILIGWFQLLKRKLKTGIFLLGWWLIALIPAAIPLTVPHALRSLNALPVMALVIGYGSLFIFRARGHLFRIILFGWGLITLVSFGLYEHDYWQHYPERSAGEWQWGYEQLASYLNPLKSQYLEVYVTPGDRLFLYLLFFEQVPPAEIQPPQSGYTITQFQNIRMTSISEAEFNQLVGRSLVVLSPGEFQDYKIKPPVKSVLRDYQGKAQFIIIEKT